MPLIGNFILERVTGTDRISLYVNRVVLFAGAEVSAVLLLDLRHLRDETIKRTFVRIQRITEPLGDSLRVLQCSVKRFVHRSAVQTARLNG